MARPSAARRDAFALSEAQPTTTLVEQVRVALDYDYDQLPDAYRERAKQAAQTIKPRLKRAAEDIFVIGAELNAVKAAFAHGEFGRWLGVEFGLSPRMAQHFMNVATRLMDKSEKFSLLPPSSLYLLAAPTTPDQAIVEVEQKLDAGERVQVARVAHIIELAREQARLTAPVESVELPLLNDAERQRAQRLARRLADVVRRLEGQPSKDWTALFDNRRLARVRSSLVDLLQEVQELLGDRPRRAVPPTDDIDIAPNGAPADLT